MIKQTLVIMAILVAGFFGTPHAKAAKRPNKLVWAGLERGPLSPAEAAKLQALLLDELDGYKSFRLIDASGNALDQRLLASDAARCAMLKDEGVDLFLNFKHRKALKKFNQALQIFESRLVSLQDYELIHDTLLAKAEAHFQAKQRGAAQRTLENLAALSPPKEPSSKTHDTKFVRLWKRAKRTMSPYGRVNIRCKQQGCTIQLDGQRLGEAPLVATRIVPGKHYVIANWGHAQATATVRVAPGREAKVTLTRDGPTEDARLALMGTAERREGLEAAEQQAQRVAKLARAVGILLAAVRERGDKRVLLVAKHSPKGTVESVVEVKLDGTVDSQKTAKAIRTMGAAIFVDERLGEFKVDADSGASLATGLLQLLYEGRAEGLVLKPKLTGPGEPPGGPSDKLVPKDDLTDPLEDPTTIKTEGSVTERWWFWAALGGAAAVAGAVTAGLLLSAQPPDTIDVLLRLP